MKANELVAWNLRRLRTTRGVAQDKLANEAEIDRTYVSRLERGLENPTVNVLEKLAVALDIAITELFDIPAPDAKPPQPLPRGRPWPKNEKSDE